MNKNIINITDINLASVLLAAATPIAAPAELIITERGETMTFYFVNTDETAEMISQWRDHAFVENNPNHPFALVKAAFDCRRGILDGIKNKRMRKVAVILSNDGERMAIIPEGSPDESEMLGRLNA